MNRTLVLGLLSVVPACLCGQGRISGRVFDATDSAIVARVQLVANDKVVAETDGFGRYEVKIPVGLTEITLRILGYKAMNLGVVAKADTNLTQDVYLERLPQLLSGMVVHGKSVRVPAGFEQVYRRAKMHDGQLITKERIDSINPLDIPSLLRTESNLHATQTGLLSAIRCPGYLDVWYNGVMQPTRMAMEEIVSHIPPNMIQAVEIYVGQARVPRELVTVQPDRSTTCGVVVIWSRLR